MKNALMHNTDETRSIDVVILCGGLGTRLKSIAANRPKPMVEIQGKPFLDILVEYVAGYGFRRFILCTGYRSSVIEEHYRDKPGPLTFVIEREPEPLGTAGALKNAEKLVQSKIVLCLNGDSFCDVNLVDFLHFHKSKKGLATIAVTRLENTGDYGVISMRSNQQITRFHEKQVQQGTGLVNAGLYFFSSRIFKEISPNQKLSLEYDIFPSILDQGIYGYSTDKKLFDIGTPERLMLTKKYFNGTFA